MTTTASNFKETSLLPSLFRKLFRSIFGSLSEWSLFERVWLLSFTLINLIVFALAPDSPLGLLASLSGMLCVVLVAKGKISNYFFGLIQVVSYAVIAYSFSLYGEVMLNLLFYAPLQFLGFYLWMRNSKKAASRPVSEDLSETASGSRKRIEVKQLSPLALTLTLLSSVALIGLYALFLNSLDGASVGLDSATTVLSIVAQILMLLRFAEQWLLWIVVNVLSIIMWALALTVPGAEPAWSVLLMWVAFLFNSCYGYKNWLAMAKEDKVEVGA